MLGICVIGPAQADEQRAACSNACDRLFDRCGLAVVNGVETANLQPLAHELDPAAMLGLRPQRDEINLRPRASAPKEGVGTIAQMFERLCEPHRHERAFGRRKRLALRRANRNLDRRLGEIGVCADAGDRRLQASGVSSSAAALAATCR